MWFLCLSFAMSCNIWMTLVPPRGSWAWEWYPDGEMWQDAIREYGLHNAVSIILNQTIAEAHRMANATNATNNQVMVE
jgi:hypothetical protein